MSGWPTYDLRTLAKSIKGERIPIHGPAFLCERSPVRGFRRWAVVAGRKAERQ